MAKKSNWRKWSDEQNRKAMELYKSNKYEAGGVLKKTVFDCRVPVVKPHGGRQFLVRGYFLCGCDMGYCENHRENPFLSYEIGNPRKCKKHKATTT